MRLGPGQDIRPRGTYNFSYAHSRDFIIAVLFSFGPLSHNILIGLSLGEVWAGAGDHRKDGLLVPRRRRLGPLNSPPSVRSSVRSSVRTFFISKSVHRIVLVFCTKLQHNKRTEVTFSLFPKKISF